jgi:hypothetical protein
VLLVKPQFEVGRHAVGPGGVVRNPEAWREALRSVWDACAVQDLEPLDVAVSPLPGPAGNVEFFVHARRRAGDQDTVEHSGRRWTIPNQDPDAVIAAVVERGRAMGARSSAQGSYG